MKGYVSGYKEMIIPFNYFTREEAVGLMVVLPGSGYTAQAPLLHYANHFSEQLHYDLLQVTYNYNDEAYDDFTNEELGEAIKIDVQTVIDAILGKKHYPNYCFIAKSLGTIALSSELMREEFKNAKAVWQTPLIHREDVLTSMRNSTQKGLSIIGDADQIYSEERVALVEQNPNMISKVIPRVGHALDVEGNALKSIDILKEVMTEIQEFLK
ncbi:hypothetical protein ACFOZY_00150 [Chungangia koreensis]|uniref:Alpha/beta hydrolase n=1 Tax=Chungangia koreensis TaxID=752657 RepID=A0ABV8X167_9LACT